MLAWPVPISLTPLRPGALAIGAPVADLRDQQSQLEEYVLGLRETYLAALAREEKRDSAEKFLGDK